MGNIKIEAVRRIAAMIECHVPSLKGNVCAGPSGRDHRRQLPSLALDPKRFKYTSQQADDTDYVRGGYIDGGPLHDVYDVGDWTGTIEFRLATKTPGQRYAIEHKIEQLFLGGATFTDKLFENTLDGCLRPGVIQIDIPECYGARIILTLEAETWRNEKTFSNEWETILKVQAILPALVSKKAAPLIETLNLKLTEDLETVVTSCDSVPADTEAVIIDENGNLTQE